MRRIETMTQTTTTRIVDLIARIEARADRRLYRIARRRRPRVQGWWGHADSTGCVRRYTCYVCDAVVDTDAGKWRPTVHAQRALEAHRAEHLTPTERARVEALQTTLVALECRRELVAAAKRRELSRARRSTAGKAAYYARTVRPLVLLGSVGEAIFRAALEESRAWRPLDLDDRHVIQTPTWWVQDEQDATDVRFALAVRS
jgi:hypothetical protein